MQFVQRNSFIQRSSFNAARSTQLVQRSSFNAAHSTQVSGWPACRLGRSHCYIHVSNFSSSPFLLCVFNHLRLASTLFLLLLLLLLLFLSSLVLLLKNVNSHCFYLPAQRPLLCVWCNVGGKSGCASTVCRKLCGLPLSLLISQAGLSRTCQEESSFVLSCACISIVTII